MPNVQSTLDRRLRELNVQADSPDTNTLILRDVPIDPATFNHAHTNLLLKRPNPGLPFVVGVDESLEYLGSDPQVVRAFAGGVKRDGWRIVPLGILDRELPQAVDRALGMLGVDNRRRGSIDRRTPQPSTLLESCAIDMTAALDEGGGELTCGRGEELDTVVSTLLCVGQVRMPVIAGRSGVGKTNLLWATARKLQSLRPDWRVLSVDLPSLWAGAMFDAERERLFATILDDARRIPGAVLAIELLGVATFGHCGLLLTKALDQGLRAIGTTLLDSLARFRSPPLARRTLVVELRELRGEDALAALQAVAPQISESHGVEITPSLLRATLQAARPLAGRFPAKAAALLDAAASRAALSGNDSLSLDDVCTAARSFPGERDEK